MAKWNLTGQFTPLTVYLCEPDFLIVLSTLRLVSLLAVDDTTTSDKGQEPDSHLLDMVHSTFLSYWLSEVRPPSDPETDLSGTWGMGSWLAGEDMGRRGHMNPEVEQLNPESVLSGTEPGPKAGMCNHNTPCEGAVTWHMLLIDRDQGFYSGAVRMSWLRLEADPETSCFRNKWALKSDNSELCIKGLQYKLFSSI